MMIAQSLKPLRRRKMGKDANNQPINDSLSASSTWSLTTPPHTHNEQTGDDFINLQAEFLISRILKALLIS